ncbi:histone-like nucleoid-structuring protein Lsr2 [Rhodococcus sp. CH91]|uniref:histone-like nucleoid-structuring protein Lsr2 n=1 Tax=Rhodococcus sp. CH91 TaxID=2910256 RepID=UPI001F4A550A|nr:Lsr2 family protein [Rhodococcus sp. CH91]
MAQKVRVQYFDDIDGQPIMDGLAQSFRIRVDDDEYELDLRPSNADKFLAVLRPWLHEKASAQHGPAAHTITPKKTPAKARTRTSGAHKTIPPTRSPEQLAAIRHWARNKGYDVSSRGRIPRHILEQFEAAHS